MKIFADSILINFFVWFGASSVILSIFPQSGASSPKSFIKLRNKPNAQRQAPNILECFRKTSAIDTRWKLYWRDSTRMPLSAEELKGGGDSPFFLSTELSTHRDVLGCARMLSVRATHIKHAHYFRNNYCSGPPGLLSLVVHQCNISTPSKFLIHCPFSD